MRRGEAWGPCAAQAKSSPGEEAEDGAQQNLAEGGAEEEPATDRWRTVRGERGK